MIDDEQNFTALLKLNLEKTGAYEVRAENQGQMALAIAKAFHPDLILLDVIMPDMDGGSVAALMRSDPATKEVPILFLTAVLTRKESEERSGVLSGHRCVAKPIEPAELCAVIDEQLKG
ncbi:MAG: response regulator [Candidatus Omnitrophica bacterium]|nr:response regulator [Candidatus Omnitrophota bacterium]